MVEKTIGTPSNGDFSGAAEKLGAISVQFSGYKKSRKRLFINDLRLSFCGERGSNRVYPNIPQKPQKNSVECRLYGLCGTTLGIDGWDNYCRLSHYIGESVSF